MGSEIAMKGFLYGQTEFNLLNNSIRLDDYFTIAKEHNFSFLSITDENLYASFKFYKKCKTLGIKPIIGLEIKYIDDDDKKSVILAYAKNNRGYKNLLKISTYLKSNPIPIGLEFLYSYKDNIIFIAVYNDCILERYFLEKKYEVLNEKLLNLSSTFDFYLGYSYTNRLDRLNSNQAIYQYASELGIRLLPIHNCRYLRNEDSIIYETLTQISGSPIKLSDFDDYSVDINPIVTDELAKMIESIDLELFSDKTYLPIYPKTNGVASDKYLSALCHKGLSKRLGGKVKPEYHKRLEYELSVINKMGYSDYFLIVWDFILFAKKKNILVGPGRGSAAGSLVAYCLGITEIDPLKYDLFFERFLNPERISMPDIDTDFPDNYRDEVIGYVNQTYGSKHVCTISSYSTFSSKSSIRDLGRIMKIDSIRLEEIISLVENASDYDSLLNQFKDRKDIYELIYVIKGLEGLTRHVSTHAAGIIISLNDLDDIIPLQSGINGLFQSQLEAKDLEDIGLLKMDFLGIRNLSIMADIIDAIPEMSINSLRNIPLNDKKTYEILAQADTLGIFQLESEGMRNVLNKIKPNKFIDLVATLALYRPGPMDNIDEFILRRFGKKFTYLHPSLESVLKETYGIIVYQEQVMQIAQIVAGFTLGQADLLRRAVSKKNPESLKQLSSLFISGAITNGYSETLAQSIYNYILKFGNYGFNKSHSVAYGLLVYQMSYLKANYFEIFLSKILNNVIGSAKTMSSYINYAKEHNLHTYSPNVNISSRIFENTKVGIFMPLTAIRSVGEIKALEIVNERKANGLYKDYSDFKKRTMAGPAILEALIFSGALDCFGLSKKQMFETKEIYSDIFAKHLVDIIEDESEFDFGYLQQRELEYLGFNLKYNIFNDIEKLHKKFNADYVTKSNRAIISIVNQKIIKTKKQDTMIVGTLTDNITSYKFVIFPQTLQSINFKLDSGRLYTINYIYEYDEKYKTYQVIIKNVIEC